MMFKHNIKKKYYDFKLSKRFLHKTHKQLKIQEI